MSKDKATAESYAEIKRRLRAAVDADEAALERRLQAAVERGRAAMERRYYAGFAAKPEADPWRAIAAGFLIGIIVAFGLAYLFITQ